MVQVDSRPDLDESLRKGSDIPCSQILDDAMDHRFVGCHRCFPWRCWGPRSTTALHLPLMLPSLANRHKLKLFHWNVTCLFNKQNHQVTCFFPVCNDTDVVLADHKKDPVVCPEAAIWFQRPRIESSQQQAPKTQRPPGKLPALLPTHVLVHISLPKQTPVVSDGT